MNKADLDEFIQKHIPIKTYEKNTYGEVFTNPILIHKMLDLFPQNVWSNPSQTWLDPAAGTGFFMICVYARLMSGLAKWEPNDKKRSKHIIHNMLYMVELNKTNCDICKHIFGTNVHLFCGDFLSLSLSLSSTTVSFKLTSFDCIVGNPPYQDNYGLSKHGKRINGGKSKLYERIFLKSYELLTDGGYLSFVVPDNIFSGNGSHSYQTIIQNKVPFVSFNPNTQAFFHKIQQLVCYFILEKRPCTTTDFTTIEHDDKLIFQIKLQDRPVNPIRDWTPQTEQLIRKFVSSSTRNNVVYNRGKIVSSYKGNKYPLIYTPTSNLGTNNIDLAPGIHIKKAVVFSISPQLEFKMDYSGRFGAGPNTFYIPFTTNTEGKRLEKFLQSNHYKMLALATKTSRQFLKIAFLEHLKLTSILNKNNSATKTKKNKKHKKNRTTTRKQ